MAASAELLAIVSEVSKSPTFQIESSRARAVLECAKYMQTLSTVAELRAMDSFCDEFYTCLEKLCTDMQT